MKIALIPKILQKDFFIYQSLAGLGIDAVIPAIIGVVEMRINRFTLFIVKRLVLGLG